MRLYQSYESCGSLRGTDVEYRRSAGSLVPLVKRIDALEQEERLSRTKEEVEAMEALERRTLAGTTAGFAVLSDQQNVNRCSAERRRLLESEDRTK
jgi:hypothetical protein